MAVWRDPQSGTQPARFERGGWKQDQSRVFFLAANAAKKMIHALDDRPANGCHRNSGLLRRNFSDLVADLHIPNMVGLGVYFTDIGQLYYKHAIANPFEPRIRRPSSIRKEGRLLIALFRTNSQISRV
jgi:hypothetical protein